MTAAIVFEFPLGWLAAIPVSAALAFAAWQQHQRGLSRSRIAYLAVLRLAAFLPLLFLATRPIWLNRAPLSASSRPVVLLMDRSESMSLAENGTTRYEEALQFLRQRLLPAFKATSVPVRALLFDESTELADGRRLAATKPSGKRTNLAGAIAQALEGPTPQPLAVIALTDGSANEDADNSRALGGLLATHTPFIGLGFGSDQGLNTLSLRRVEAPSTVASKTSFSISARLEMMDTEPMPAFDLLLLRDGQVVQKRTANPGKGARDWLESFRQTEETQGAHTYTVQLVPPEQPGLKCLNALASVPVRIADQKELRLLYMQGALTWDYKFISLALHSDPAIKITGLARTSHNSVFRQNVESAGELVNGFPTSLAELAPFRIVVLSNLRPSDLSAGQQEMLARFCGELGGGVLLIGGPATFDSSWKNSRLEQLLPVTFSSEDALADPERPFHLQLTQEALENPVFQIAEDRSSAEAWAQLPTFSRYARVDAAKPGALVWMRHPADQGPEGKRILMAAQRYGAGLSAVLCAQNFWRWRLAKDSNPGQFDRFWRQLFRWLGDTARQDVAIHLADQELHPGMDVHVTIEKQPSPASLTNSNQTFFVRVLNEAKQVLHEEAIALEPLQPVDFSFYAQKAGDYTVLVTDNLKTPVCTRPIEIREPNIELQNTARNMETLRQWASVSDGLAFKVEDCPDAADLVSRIKGKIQEVRHAKMVRRPIGLNGWTLTLVLAGLCGDWLARKHWGLR